MIVDVHTDVLSKLLINNQLDFYKDSEELCVNYPNMIKSGLDVQVFAIFVSNLPSKYLYTLKSIDDFYEKIIKLSENIELAKNYNDIENSLKNKKKIAILSLEGADALSNDLTRLRNLYRLGVRALGLTWNNANKVADGIMVRRGRGLTKFGKEVVIEANRLGIMIDVSHLSEKGFWDVIEITKSPIMASHSNTRNICNHPRNLTDNQIKAIIDNGGMIGVTYVRDFTSRDNPNIESLLLHIDHIASLGGLKNIGLGSDFDGAKLIPELENLGRLDKLINALNKHYNKGFVDLVLGINWNNYFKKILIN